MNQKGIFITFMVFLLAASVIALHETSKRTSVLQERSDIEEIAFNRINNVFNNFYEEIVFLNKEGVARDVQQRSMPFEYNFAPKSIHIKQRLPARESVLRAYIDAINAYSIFINQNPEKDLEIATSALKDSRWLAEGDAYPDLNYYIMPQCLVYTVNNGQTMSLKSLVDADRGCETGFDYADLNSINLTLTINSSAYEVVDPNVGGTLNNQFEEYDDTDPYPYVQITVNEINPECPGAGCIITDSTGTTIVKTHFNPEPGPEDTLIIKVKGPPTDEQIKIKVGQEFAGDLFPLVIENEYGTMPIAIEMDLNFEQDVELFYFTGFSISVNKVNFPIKRRT